MFFTQSSGVTIAPVAAANTLAKLAIGLLFALQLPAFAAEIKLVCLDMSSLAVQFRKTSPSIGVEVYALDTSKRQVRHLEGELKDKLIYDVEVTEATVSFVQDGFINKPDLRETFRTSISRVSGEWVQHPHYLNAKGHWLSGTALEQVARANDVWGPFGIRQQPTQGECQVDARKF